MIRLGVTPEANAAATLLLAVSIGVVVLAFFTLGRGGRMVQK
jgi:spermidine/putrescine transport system permease protein